MRLQHSDLCRTALLAAFLAVSGSFKIPSFILGSEFQLSAPIAVAACGVFGVKRYLAAGVAASAVCLLLGTQSLLNVLLALAFRAVVALLCCVWGSSKIFYIAAGPVASAVSRLALSLFVGKAAYALVAAAVPGMVFTALAAPVLAGVFHKAFGAKPACTSKGS